MTRSRLTLPVAYRSFSAPQMEGSTLQPPSSGITGTAPLGGGTWALEGCQCLGRAGPSPSLRGREAVTLCPSHLQPRSGSRSRIRSTLCVLRSPATPRRPNHPQQGALLGFCPVPSLRLSLSLSPAGPPGVGLPASVPTPNKAWWQINLQLGTQDCCHDGYYTVSCLVRR